ncbi:hypothetical protein [Plebeiibacterium marinum]|uniref:T9SS type A sorting domain-containing protein n=1 Tax=Plebeiibacterium marinum TaxID=2992111 RepID=A0AAE3SJL9_9BACT|nr:hypothetical protein [Plebeiobacterium marinum]MCW3805867.1 T9SS type A sorting domain-containing protein [Plebeiobacterium marinum]
MKSSRLFKGLALGVMFALTTTVFAGEGEGKAPASKVSILPYLHTDYSILSVSNFSAKNAVLLIENNEGVVFHKEWIDQPGFTQKVLDFSHLSDGEYSVILKQKGSESLSKSFIVEDHKIVTDKKKSASLNKANSFVKVTDNTLLVSHLDFSSRAFSISITDANSEELFTQTVTGGNAFSKKYDISALPTGNYTVQINSDNKNYTYAFNK